MTTAIAEHSVLIVEAKHNFQSILQVVAEQLTHKPAVIVNSAEKALEKLSQEDFNLIVVGELEDSVDVLALASKKNPLGALLFFTNDISAQEAAHSIAKDVRIAPYEQMALPGPVMELLATK